MSHDNEEWRKIWRGIDLSFQNWHEEFDEFWLEYTEVSNVCTLIGSFWPRHIMFELKMSKGVIFHDTEEWWKIWRRTDFWFGNCQEEFGRFSPEDSKVSILELWCDPFIQNRKYMSLRFTEELCVMEVKNDGKFGEGLTCCFKIVMRNLANFDPSTLKSQKLTLYWALLIGLFCPRYIMFELKMYRGVMLDSIEDWCKIWRKIDLCFLKWHKEFGKFFQAEKNDFILEGKMTELNQNKNSKQPDQPDAVQKRYFTLKINELFTHALQNRCS